MKTQIRTPWEIAVESVFAISVILESALLSFNPAPFSEKPQNSSDSCDSCS